MSTMERILRTMGENNASDIYLSANSPILFRINGQCVPINNQLLPFDAPRNLLAEVVSPAQTEEFDEIGELNTAFALRGVGRFRVSAMRQRGTCAVVIRHISSEVPTLESLNLPESLSELVMEKHGLVLVVGATGSGKSSTLAAMLENRNVNSTSHILTIEDPIEFLFKNKRSIINQREIGADTQSFQVALKNALRQAPDVIMIGEIRDRETMSAAIAYAQSGHLCLATLHANNSYNALNRILSFYPVEVRPVLLNDLSTSLKGIVSQRLLRTVQGKRLPAIEIMRNSSVVSDLIRQGAFSQILEAMEKSMVASSQTFEQAIATLIQENKVTREEGMLYADSPTNLIWRLQNDFGAAAKAALAAQKQKEENEPNTSFTEFTFD